MYPSRLVLPPHAGNERRVVRVANTGATQLRVQVALDEFTQSPQGEIRFRRPGPLSAASWVTVKPTSFELAPRETVPVAVTLRVPAHPEPGERYVGVLFRVPARGTGHNIRVSGAVAVELLIDVPGRIVHDIAIGPLRTPLFAMGGPIPLTLSVHNRGNVHRDYVPPHRLVATLQRRSRVKFPSFTVLGNSTRTIRTQWVNPPLFCICHATVRTSDGQGHVVSAEATFYILPLRQVGGVIIVALGLFLLIRLVRH